MICDDADSVPLEANTLFTGIVERTALLSSAEDTAGGRRLTIVVEPRAELPPWRSVELGESIALCGVCLTAVACEARDSGGEVTFEAVPETLQKTTLGSLEMGDVVNVERSLRVGDSFGGHYVTGHVDGTARVANREVEGDQVLFRIATSPELLRQTIIKGSIVVDGVSLTVVDVDRTAGWFSFAAIPHTLERTTLGETREGDSVNLETDAVGKWVLHGLSEMISSTAGNEERLRVLLERAGFTEDP